MKHLADIRSHFLTYFQKAGHELVPSSPLIPRNDPSLLFTNAGMVQFKDIFTGLESRAYKRATSSQKCFRAIDLENVGYTARHHTFFEMLGNFSFGDYFKETAIELAWNLITKDFALSEDRLLVTVYAQDEEAAALWKKIAGLPQDKIIRIPTDDNFWSMGETGPCGPCSEIFFDHGSKIHGGPPGSDSSEGDRFVEVWNLVFMQFEKHANGTQIPLPRPSIDTGMGLERISAVLQGVHSNYETDLFQTLIQTTMELTKNKGQIQSHRVIADHIRAISFLVAEGITPANEGRGYVLRRIMRRAIRHANLLGVKEPILWKVIPTLGHLMGTAYPEIVHAQPQIISVLKNEEERFGETLNRGLKLLQEAVAPLPSGASLSGSVAFKLYDTYGFPLDLTQDVLKSSGHAVDVAEFQQHMEQQRVQARASWMGSGEVKDEAIWFDLMHDLGQTEFIGYDTTQAEGYITAIVKEGQGIECAQVDEDVFIVTNQTPFYGESGGQVGDTGLIETAHARLTVTDTLKKLEGLIIHKAKVVKGTVHKGETAKLIVDKDRRNRLRAHHSATHLLHAALRHVLGDHVMQKGSYVSPESLRFDFAHHQSLSTEERQRIGHLVNQFICDNYCVETQIMSPETAIASGATALFGERYGQEVRVLKMGEWEQNKPFSVELCGGTHVSRTGDIGCFKIISETSIAAGVRRIIAKTGIPALDDITLIESRFLQGVSILKATPENFLERLQKLLEEKKSLEHQVTEQRQQLALQGQHKETPQIETVGTVRLTTRHLEGLSPKELKVLVDTLKNEIGSGVVIVSSTAEDKISLVIGVTSDLTQCINAVDLVHIGSTILGGKGGGGRPDMAQAGGTNPSALPEAIVALKKALSDLSFPAVSK